MRRVVENFSIYSLISMRTIVSSESNNSLANTLANWVLPTPVCPKNINDPIGLLGSFSPVRLRLIALTTFSTASSCPMIFDFIMAESSASLFISVCAIRLTGIPLIIETTSAMCSSVITSRCSLES